MTASSQKAEVDVAEERRRIDSALDAGLPHASSHGVTLAETPDASSRRALQQAVRAQILAFCEQEVTAKTLNRLQRFCDSMGKALAVVEDPADRARNKFGDQSIALPDGSLVAFPAFDPSDALATAPFAETYGTNASRSLIAEAAAIGKNLMEVQAKAQAEARKPMMPELVMALVSAKRQKLPKSVLQALERQIMELDNHGGAQ